MMESIPNLNEARLKIVYLTMTDTEQQKKFTFDKYGT